ncbi:MAG: hypothetical protein ABUL62_34770 [Myxococcales bacterium]
MRFAPHSLVLCAGLGLLACSSSAGTTTAIVRPQLLSVLPEDFLGKVPCSPDFGSLESGGTGGAATGSGVLAAKSYVATLTDVTPTDTDGSIVNFVLPTSPPTRCTQPVTFGNLVTYHFYIAHIDAYTENAEELTPFAPGSPLILDTSGNRVAARWSADCGGYPPSPAAGGTGGGGGSDAVGGGGTAGNAGLTGVVVYDTVTQTPHGCGMGLAPIE